MVNKYKCPCIRSDTFSTEFRCLFTAVFFIRRFPSLALRGTQPRVPFPTVNFTLPYSSANDIRKILKTVVRVSCTTCMRMQTYREVLSAVRISKDEHRVSVIAHVTGSTSCILCFLSQLLAPRVALQRKEIRDSVSVGSESSR